MLTEDEAMKRWCPFARVWACDVEGSMDNVAINRFGDTAKTLHPNAFCIGSRCMAWRQQTYFKNSKTGEYPMAEGMYEPGTAAECGYCGLAGHPFPAAAQPGAT